MGARARWSSGAACWARCARRRPLSSTHRRAALPWAPLTLLSWAPRRWWRFPRWVLAGWAALRGALLSARAPSALAWTSRLPSRVSPAAPARPPTHRQALERAGLTKEDIEIFELNEAFASQAGAWVRGLWLLARSLHASAARAPARAPDSARALLPCPPLPPTPSAVCLPDAGDGHPRGEGGWATCVNAFVLAPH